MRNKTKLKKIFLTVFHIILLCYILFWMTLFFVMTPYQDFDYSLKIADYYKIDVLMIMWPAGAIVNGTIAFIAKKYSKIFTVIHLILAVFCVSYFIWLLTL